ncbi:MAG: hypothetical protein GTN49_05920 [candidate division Zixibacteria bacterium]|nr:hypothetical protein [candidate division Zixibacteria bacterium]
MRLLTLMAVLGTLLASESGATPPGKYVDENFNAAFPPAGWIAEGTGNWVWRREYEGGNPHAFGRALVTGGRESTATLHTLEFHLNAGSRVRVKFRYKSTSGGYINTWRNVRLGSFWSEKLQYTKNWMNLDRATGPCPSPGKYRLRWRIGASGGSSGGEITLRLDDVLVTDINMTVTPATFGRVKAIFR